MNPWMMYAQKGDERWQKKYVRMDIIIWKPPELTILQQTRPIYVKDIKFANLFWQ